MQLGRIVCTVQATGPNSAGTGGTCSSEMEMVLRAPTIDLDLMWDEDEDREETGL